jgi:hypothetical protein
LRTKVHLTGVFMDSFPWSGFVRFDPALEAHYSAQVPGCCVTCITVPNFLGVSDFCLLYVIITLCEPFGNTQHDFFNLVIAIDDARLPKVVYPPFRRVQVV